MTVNRGQKQERRKIYQSDKSAPNIELTKRDVQILRYLAQHRFLDPKYFLLEVDRGTEPIVRSNLEISSIVQKMLAYADTYKRGLLELPNCRVLFVTTSQARIQSMQNALTKHISAPPGLFLFTTHEHVATDPLGAIWQDGKGRKMSLLD